MPTRLLPAAMTLIIFYFSSYFKKIGATSWLPSCCRRRRWPGQQLSRRKLGNSHCFHRSQRLQLAFSRLLCRASSCLGFRCRYLRSSATGDFFFLLRMASIAPAFALRPPIVGISLLYREQEHFGVAEAFLSCGLTTAYKCLLQ